jgi:hypothetical protein
MAAGYLPEPRAEKPTGGHYRRVAPALVRKPRTTASQESCRCRGHHLTAAIDPELPLQTANYCIARELHSPLMFAALMIGHHLSISAFCNAPRAAGVCWARGKTSCPKSASRARTFGSAKASMTAALSLAVILFGVPLGTQLQYRHRHQCAAHHLFG